MTHQKHPRTTRYRNLFLLALLTGLLTVNLWAHPTQDCQPEVPKTPVNDVAVDLKMQAFSILNNKCNTCHRKQNPFMIFTEKNMTKRASKINKQVFELKRMPKQSGTPLTSKEYAILKSWIETQ